MKTFYPFIRNILSHGQLRKIAGLAMLYVMALLLPGKLAAQAPAFTYSTPQTYAVSVAAPSLSPVSTGGAVPAFGFNTTPTDIPTGLSDPTSIVLDKSGNMYIGEGGGNISFLPAGGTTATTFATVFGSVWSVALDASNNVYAADNANVWKIPAGGGTAVSLGSFTAPVGLAFDASGYLYVAVNGGASPGVYKINTDGSGQTRIDNNLQAPAYIAFDPNGNLFIGDQATSALYEIPAGGTQKQVATGLNTIISLAADPAGNIYVEGRPAGIFCYSAGGSLVNIDAVSTYGITVDSKFNLYYCTDGHVWKINPDGGYFASPVLPSGLAMNSATGVISGTPLATSPATNYTVTAFNAAGQGTTTVNIKVNPLPPPAISYSTPQTYVVGTTITSLSPANTGGALGSFGFNTPSMVTTGVSDPVCMAMDKSGNMYIGESSGKVSLLPAGGSSATVFASGFGPVNSIVLDASNNVYLADGVKVWKIPAGGGTAISLNSFYNPLGLTIDASGNLYVGDNNIPDSFGAIFEMATDGSGKKQFVIAENPPALVFDANGTEYDLEGTSLDGEVLQEVGGGGNFVAAFAPNESYLAVDGAGNIFEAGSGGINYYSSVMGGTFNISAVSAKGIMFDANNNLYYADGSNIYKMSPAGGYYISPSLPSGLSFNSNTGVISGAPANTSPATNYTVTAFNASGSSTTTINITVNPHLPVISYSSPQSYQAGTAVALTPSSSNVASWGYSNLTAIGTFFQAPTDVVADGAGNIYVAEFGKGRLNKIPAGGGAAVVVASGFSGPFGLAIDAAGNLYITDSGNNLVKEIPAGTSTANIIGSGFNGPAALAVDGSGNVYVGDTGNGALKEIPAGNGTPVTLQTGFTSIQGVAVDAAGNIYVADAGTGSNGAVYKVPPGGGSMVSVGTGFSRPSGIVVDAAGNLYVSDINQAAITVIKPDGTQFTIGSGVVRANGVALDASGNLYIADTGTGFVEKVKINGGYFLSPLLPAGLTFNSSTGVISGTPAVSSPTANYTVTGWNVTGSSLATVSITVGAPIITYTSPVAYATGAAITPLTPSVAGGAVPGVAFGPSAALSTGLSDATCTAVDKSGNIYIGESSGQVSKLAPGASSATVFATGFANVGESIEGIAVDASGNVYFADDASVWKIPAGGGTATTLGSFLQPVGVAVDATGNIYVDDDNSASYGVYKMASDGTGKTRIDQSLVTPVGLGVDANGNVFVGDQLSQALYKIPAGGAQTQLTNINNIQALTIDAGGDVYASAGPHLYIWPAGGGGLVTIGSTSLFALGIMSDANFNLYWTNGTVNKLSPTGGYFISPELPPGLTISPAGGTISGTPAAAAPTTNYTVKAFNTAASATATVNITVGPAPAISYSTPPAFTVGAAISPLLPTSTGAAVSAPGFNTKTVTLTTGITDATCITMDKNGNLYIGELSGKVCMLAPGSTTATVLATGFRTYSSSTFNEGIAVDASGNVYFADGSSLWKIPAGGGTPAKFSSFDAPLHVSIDAAGSLYVSDFAQGIYKMAPDGTNKTRISTVPANTMAADQNGNVFFSSRGSLDKLLEIPAGGTQITFNANPVRVCATDPSGNAYVVNNDLSINLVPASGTTATQVEPATTGLTGIMIGPDFNLYAVVNGGIVKTNFSGGYFISPELPEGLTIDPTSGVISGTPTAISAAANYTVTAFSGSVSASATLNLAVNGPPVISYATPQVYTPGIAITPLAPSNTGAVVGAFGFNTLSATLIPGVTDAVSLAMDKSGNLYIGEGTGNISVLPAGASTATVFATGFPAAWSVALDASNNVFVADGQHVWKIPAGGGTAVSLGSFHSPVGLAFDAAGKLYVADNSGATGGVFKMNSDGTGQTRIDNNLPQPAYLAFDNNGNLFIGDQIAQALYEIPAGGVQKQVASGLGVVVSVKTDPSGNVYVSGRAPNNIYCYSQASGLTSNIAPFETDGLMTDANFNLYYAFGNIYKLSPSGGYFTNSQLPAGLTIDPNSGVISGTPTAVSPATNYTVTAYNLGGNGSATVSIAVLSADATLASLSLSKGTLSPTFSSGVTSYTANVPYSASSITVTATPNDPNASSVTTTVNGNPASGTAPLNVGSNTIVVTVIAQDRITTKSYTVTVNRGTSFNANLARLTLPGGTLVPGFAPSVTTYHVTVENNVLTETITPTVSDPNATVTVNGTAVASGNASNPIALAMGDNTVTLVVTAPNGVNKTYTVTITRVLSSDAYLSNLAIRDDDKLNADIVALSPGFNFRTMTYTAAVPVSQSSVTVKPVSIDPNAVIKINGKVVTTKTFSNPIALNTGANTITIVVTAPGGATQTYAVTVTRALPADAYLSNLVVNTAALSPAFVYNTFTYSADVPNETASVTIKANVIQAGATFTVNGNPGEAKVASDPIALAVGDNTITIVVTAPDNSTTQTYTVTVTRDQGSENTVYQPVGVEKPTESLGIAEDGIKVHQGISPNGDGIEDFLQIDNISQYPDNKLSIMNRNGQLVYEAKGYDNSSKTFDGHSNKNGRMQLPGTYFYQLDYTANGITKHKTGFIVLKY